MQLHALLPDDSHRRLTAVVAHRHKVVRLSAVCDLARAATAGEVAACVVDPFRGRPGVIETLAAALESGDFPVLLYTSLDGSRVREVLELQQRSGADVLFCVHDEQPEYLRRAIDRIGAVSLAPLLLRELAPEFNQLPDQLGARCAGLFGGWGIPKTTSEFFAYSRVNERTGIRWMKRARLRGTEDLLRCARLVLTWEDVRDPASNLADVALRAGIGTERALYNAYRNYCGLPPRRAARDLPTAELAIRAASAMRV
jgi:hypothetical protein